jgi:hypothetical protein
MVNVFKGSGGYDVAYRIDGNKIYSGSGGYDVAYTINGDKVYKGSTGYGDVAYTINGNKVYKGSTGYGDVAFRIGYDEDRTVSSSSGEKPSGCLGMILAFFGFIFIKLPIGGKICAIAGAVLPIIGALTGSYPGGNVIFFAPLGFLIGGGIGALGNFIIPKLSKTGKLGTLIGAVVLIIAFEIMLFTGNISTAFGNIVGFAIFGLIIGSILGAIIGSIVGLIQKKVGKKKE